MRWIIAAALTGILIGMCGGLGLGLSVGRAPVIEASATPFATEMSVERFMQCSEVAPEPDYEALVYAPWRVRQIQ